MSLHVGEVDLDPIKALHEVYRVYELESIPDGSGSSHFGGPERWIFGLDMVRIDPARCGYIEAAIQDLRGEVQVGPLVQAMLNRLRPGGELKPHRDGPPDRLRFHLPLCTNSAAYWWDEINGHEHMMLGNWYGPVPYCGVLHSAANPGTTDRVHLVADFERR